VVCGLNFTQTQRGAPNETHEKSDKNNKTTGTRRRLGVIYRSGKLEVAAQLTACRLMPNTKYQAEK